MKESTQQIRKGPGTETLDSMKKTTLVRRSSRLEMIKGAGEAKLVEETVEKVWNLTRTWEESAKKRKWTNIECEERESGKSKRKRSSTIGEEDVGMPKKVRKVKVTKTLPAPALEKVFSYLNWKDLARAMLVCQRWRDLGGHPSLWTKFPLKISGQGLKRFAKIRRLAWVRSVSVHLPKAWVDLQKEELGLSRAGITGFNAVLKSLPRLEELFVYCNSRKTRYGEVSDIDTFLWECRLQDIIFKILLSVFWGTRLWQWRCQRGGDICNTTPTSLIWIFSADSH